jgi:multidrug resistance efflux pump
MLARSSNAATAVSNSDLDRADRRVAQARARLERQREIVQTLAARRQDTSTAAALLRTMRRTLEAFEEDRRLIEDEMFAARSEGVSFKA